MSEQGNTLSYALTPNLGRSTKSVAVKRYSAQMKSTGTFGDTELQEALASESKISVEQIRYLEAVRRRIIENALKDGKKGITREQNRTAAAFGCLTSFGCFSAAGMVTVSRVPPALASASRRRLRRYGERGKAVPNLATIPTNFQLFAKSGKWQAGR